MARYFRHLDRLHALANWKTAVCYRKVGKQVSHLASACKPSRIMCIIRDTYASDAHPQGHLLGVGCLTMSEYVNDFTIIDGDVAIPCSPLCPVQMALKCADISNQTQL